MLALVVERQKSTELFTEGELIFLKKFLYYNIAAQVAATRKEIVHLYKKTFTRINEGLAVLNRTIKNETKHKQIIESKNQTIKCPMQLQYDIETITNVTVTDATTEAIKNKNLYVNFLNQVLRECLLPGLLNDANFPRRSTCLELLLFFHETFKEKRWKDVWLDDDIFNLKYVIIFDSYESNKQLAVKLYKYISTDKMYKVSKLSFTYFLL